MPADIISTLRVRGRTQAGDLAQALGVSRPTLSRAVRAAGPQLLVRGSARRTQYAARRALRGSGAPLPLFRVDMAGRVVALGQLELAYPDGCAFSPATPPNTGAELPWPLDADMRDGWFDGLPYFMQDLRPQGFLGRNFARQHAALLQVGEDPTTWSDDDTLHALSLLGSDGTGDLIVGEAACQRWLAQVQQWAARGEAGGLAEQELALAYPRLADLAMAQGQAGSSAGGEFPKFTALRRWDHPDSIGGPRWQPVLVKFSGSDTSPGTERWSDLLVCEHLAGQVLGEELGLPAAASAIHRHGGRTFLEVERFDRHGALGRSGLVSWQAVNAAFFGSDLRQWHEAARQLLAQDLLSDTQARQVALVWFFGQLIANNDMHSGNLSFVPGETPAALRMAPVYDMLPMLYAPARGVELPPRSYTPQLPLPGDAALWKPAARAALVFWLRAGEDGRISGGFRAICAANAAQLQAVLALA